MAEASDVGPLRSNIVLTFLIQRNTERKVQAPYSKRPSLIDLASTILAHLR
jgi:hypothetical protein